MARRGKLRLVLVKAKILCKKGLRGKLIARQAMMINRVEQGLPSTSDIAKADDIELQENMENAARSMEDLIAQLDDQMHSLGDLLEHPLHELWSLNKEQVALEVC